MFFETAKIKVLIHFLLFSLLEICIGRDNQITKLLRPIRLSWTSFGKLRYFSNPTFQYASKEIPSISVYYQC